MFFFGGGGGDLQKKITQKMYRVRKVKPEIPNNEFGSIRDRIKQFENCK